MAHGKERGIVVIANNYDSRPGSCSRKLHKVLLRKGFGGRLKELRWGVISLSLAAVLMVLIIMPAFAEAGNRKKNSSPDQSAEEALSDRSEDSSEKGADSSNAGPSSSETGSDAKAYGPGTKKSCRIYVKNLILDASDICRQTKEIKYSCKNKGTPQYFSDSDYVTVEEGKVIIPPNYAGKAHITVIIPATDEYAASSARILVAVNRIDNPMSVYDMVEDYDREDRTIPLQTEVRGGARLHYKCSERGISFHDDKVKIRKGYTGTAEVSVTAQASGIYKETTKTFKITVLSGVAERMYEEARSQIGISGGGVNSTKYGQYTGMNHQAWCASFVSWCASNAGVNSLKPGVRSVVPKTASTLEMCQYSTDYHVWTSQAFEDMKRGDIIFFSRAEKQYQVGGSKAVCHVGIVESADPDTKTVQVIEGNSTGDSVCRHSYYADPDTGKIRKRYFCGYISVH